MSPIQGIQPPSRPVSPLEAFGKASATQRTSSGLDQFAEVLSGKLREVNSMQSEAGQMVHSMLTGGDINEAEVLTAVQKADLAFRMLLQVRNKLIEAYREIQQIQI
jgi:flagellar hook-basal body complex protein FliE